MLMEIATLLAAVLFVGVIAFGWLYVCYICVMLGRREYEDKSNPLWLRLAGAALAIIFVVPGYPLDIVFNWTYGLVLANSRETLLHLTLSGRLDAIRETQDSGWRKAAADYICLVMLNPYDADHC